MTTSPSDPYDGEWRHAEWYLWKGVPPKGLGVTCSTCSGPAVGPTLPSGEAMCELHRVEAQIQIHRFHHETKMRQRRCCELDAQQSEDDYEIRQIDQADGRKGTF
jgi:hypothetical protein